MNDKIPGIICLTIVALGEYAYCVFTNNTPTHTGTIVGAIAGVITGIYLSRK